MAKIYSLAGGSDLLEEVREIAGRDGIRSGLVSAIGGVRGLTLAYFNTRKKQYEEHRFGEFFEATSILGNITRKEGKPFVHCHGTFGKRDLSVIGGHIMAARVFPIMEVVITPTRNRALRRFDEKLGLNVIYRIEDGKRTER